MHAKVNLCFMFSRLSKTTKPQGTTESQQNFINLSGLKIGNLLVESLNYSYTHGELSTSQKEALTSLTEKKDKDWED